MPLQSIKRLAFVSTLFLASSMTAAEDKPPTTSPTTRPANFTLAQITENVEKSEHWFRNVYVKNFKTEIDAQKKGETEWQTTPKKFNGSAWFDETPGGKTRIYFALNVWDVQGGNYPYQAETSDMAWNGTQGRSLQIALGRKGNLNPTFPGHAMVITHQPPVLLASRYTRYQIGSAYTAQYFVTEMEGVTPAQPRKSISATFKRVLEVADDPKHQPSVSPTIFAEDVNGFQTICVRWVIKSSTVSAETAYWFSPEKNFALVRQLSSLVQSKVHQTETLDVKDMKEVSPGIWFPIRAERVQSDFDGGYLRYRYEAQDVIANNEKFDEAIFTPQIPVGFLVSSDDPNEALYMLDLEYNKIEIHKGEAIPNVKPQTPKRPDAK